MISQILENGRLLSLVIVLLLVAGLGSLSTLPRTEDPRITKRDATVITNLPGASAERVEALLTDPIENRLRKLPQIQLIRSTSRPENSVISIKLKDSITEPDIVWSRVRDQLRDVYPELPSGSSPPRLDDDHGYAFAHLIALKWNGSGEADLATLGRYGKELQNRLRVLSGTDFVEIIGEPDEEILVEVDPGLAGKLQLSADSIARSLAAADAKVAAGQLYNRQNQFQLELTGALDSVDRIRQVPLLSDANGFIFRVDDLAEVRQQVRWPPREIALIDNNPAVVVGVRMLPDLRLDKWSQSVANELEQFRSLLPGNIAMELLFDQNLYTETRLGELVNNILIGFLIIVSVLLITLGWRSALIVSLSLPLTVLFTLTCMNYYGLPIHQMSVTGLVVALGIMVDNAIVMTDSIQQRRQQGIAAATAVIESVQHLWIPLLGSTLTTILAFMPIVIMPGPAGEFVSGIALSVIFSLIGSYLISHTIVAGLAGRFIPREAKQAYHWSRHGVEFKCVSNLFSRSLSWALNAPKSAIALVLILPLSGFIGAKQLTEQFFPPSDRNMFQIEVYLPAQSSIMATQRVARQISAILEQKDGIEHARWFIGNNAPSFYYNMVPRQQGAQNYAQGMITTTSFTTANRLMPLLQQELDDSLPGAQILVRKLEQGPPFNAPVELRIFGANLDTLKQLGDEARRILLKTDQVVHTRATLQPGIPKVWLKTDEDASHLSGFTLTEMAGQLQSSLNGQLGGSVLEVTESIPVRVRVADDQRQDLQDLTNLSLTRPGSRNNIPLSALAETELRPSRGAIPRRNGVRVNVIEGYIRAGVLPATVLSNYSKQLEAEGFILPPGYRMEIGGESAERNKAVGKLLANVGIIFVLLITVVVLSFNSFRISTLIFLSAFQSIGLGLLSVFLFSYPFGFTVIIALLGLMGLAINAAIVILAELKADPDAIRGDKQAISRAVLSCTRHITSTTITTVGGFTPLILAGGGFWPPFAVAIAGGTLLTTLLSFYFVPAAFLMMSRRKAFEQSKGTETAAEGKAA
ncbi:efflux RND transporter permease subunit [Amphritea sp. HPY]|uniref:efflux RND transporter permease subunit n=1 Tax=Amphritea sp. HPY TaxID=3421652 RepID=UPI003D7D88CF